MTAALSHRGPDDEGFYADNQAGVHLGFRRLAILDLSSAGHQPMTSASGRYVVTFNGEIYNFRDLREQLSRCGAEFTSGSDTEVLLAALDQWGCTGTLPRLHGMFAFALWDTRERELWLARDRIGIKPLYFLHRAGALAFASEARSFHSCPLYDGRGHRAAASAFLSRLYVPGSTCLLEGVEKVGPGEVLRFRVRKGGADLESRASYWTLAKTVASGRANRITDESEAVAGLLDVLRDSVRQRLVADVPVGAFLSGGIDSSAVVGLMQELSSAPVRTFTIAFDNPDFDEGTAAAEIAAHIGTEHTVVSFSDRDVLDLVPGLPELSDEPMANPSLLPTLLVSRVARQKVVVALSGDGGDELFGGYNRYLIGAGLIRRAMRFPGFLRRGAARSLTGLAGVQGLMRLAEAHHPGSVGQQHPLSERLRKVARVVGAPNAGTAYEGLMRVGFTQPPILGAVNGSGATATSTLQSPDDTLEAWMMLTDQGGYLPDDLLTKVDRASMGESLEARVPLLDHRVVEFSWRVPTQMKIREGVSKWPLRQIAHRYVPAELLERPKMGFTAPVADWLRTDLREWARDTLHSGVSGGGLWDGKRLEDLWHSFENGRTDLALSLWTAAVLQSWIAHWDVSFS